jgi:hypothetical protein
MSAGGASLASGDLGELLDAVAALHEVERVEDFPAAALRVVRRLVPGDAAGYNEVDPTVPTLLLVTDPPTLAESAAVDRWIELSWQHPVLEHFRRSGDGSARRISDFITGEQLHGLELYREVYAAIGCEHQVCIMLPTPAPLVVAIVVNRSDRDFSDRDCAVLDALRPHLVQALRTAQLRSLLRASTEVLDQALGAWSAPGGPVDRSTILGHSRGSPRPVAPGPLRLVESQDHQMESTWPESRRSGCPPPARCRFRLRSVAAGISIAGARSTSWTWASAS